MQVLKTKSGNILAKFLACALRRRTILPMKKRINDLYVETDGNGDIIIGQPCVVADEQKVIITPEQVDVLVDWLKEAKEAAQKEVSAEVD
jgi:hypothetical protein